MAASKLHLKNVNKDYKLEATDKRTNEGRIIYKNTKTGELHSELSMTLEIPEGSGNWINVPSLINGRVYNVQGVLDMLKTGNIEPNSTGHKSETAAVEAAIFRSNNLQNEKIVGQTLPEPFDWYKGNQGWAGKAFNKIKNIFDFDQNDAKTKRLTEIMNNQDLEKDDSYFQRPIAGYINDPFTTTQYLNPRGLADREANMARGVENRAVAAEEAAIAEARKREEIIGQTMSAYGPRTGQSPIPKDAVMTYWDGRAYNGVVQMIKGKPHDAAGQELIVNDAGTVPVDDTNKAMLAKADEERELRKSQKRNKEQIDRLAAIMDRTNAEKQDDYYDVNKPRTNIFGDNNPSYLNSFKEAMTGHGIKGGLKAKQNAYEQPSLSAQDQAIFDQARKQRLLDDEKKTIGIPGYGATNQGTVSAADQAKFDAAKQQRLTPEIDTGKGSNDERKSPINIPKYIAPTDKIVPEYITIPQDVKPDYGKMPGFKFKQAKGQEEGKGYWSADSKSSFWQTDAGYEKAMQVWGEKPGWVKPGYRPKRKEVDIEAIKKWFTPSK